MTQEWHITQSKWHRSDILHNQSDTGITNLWNITHSQSDTDIDKVLLWGQLEFVTVKMTHFCDILHSQCDTRVTYYTSQSDTIVEQYTQSKWQSWIIST